eukprot:SAG31_NODE_7290_length_1730_cov_2.528510_3_plen_67_part_01
MFLAAPYAQRYPDYPARYTDTIRLAGARQKLDKNDSVVRSARCGARARCACDAERAVRSRGAPRPPP